MNKIHQFCIFIGLISVLMISSCKESKENLHKQIAQQVCDCRQPLVDLNKALLAVSQNTEENNKAFSELLVSSQKIFDKSEDCVEGIYNKMNIRDEVTYETIEAVSANLCPEIATLLNGGKE